MGNIYKRESLKAGIFKRGNFKTEKLLWREMKSDKCMTGLWKSSSSFFSILRQRTR